MSVRIIRDSENGGYAGLGMNLYRDILEGLMYVIWPLQQRKVEVYATDLPVCVWIHSEIPLIVTDYSLGAL
jgi:hypothetical protein